jgi:hypothetical protein
MRRWRLLVAGTSLILGPVVLTAGSAQATTAGYSDPRSCSSSVNSGVCIASVTALYGSSTIALDARLGFGTDPSTDPNWNSPTTFVLFGVWVNGAPVSSPSYAVGLADLSPGQFAGSVVTYPGGQVTCNGPSQGVNTTAVPGSPATYAVSFPASCIGNPSSASFVAFYSYDQNGRALSDASPRPQVGPCCTVAPETRGSPTPPSMTQGYDLVGADGGLFSYGESQYFGSMGGTALSQPVVGMANDFRTGGYWEVASDGGIFAFDAPFYGSMGGTSLNTPIVGMAVDNFTGGYWMVASDGGVFAFNAPFFGSVGGTALSQPIVGMASLPFGNGYWLVAKDGGVFSFGSAGFYGSMGGTPLNQPVVGIANDVVTGGYWLVAADGGVFAFNAPFYGSTGGIPINAPIVGIASTRGSGGYRFASSDGGVFAFGNAEFLGSAAGTNLGAPIVGIALT